MIKPTIGRIVWYYGPNHKPEDQPFAAIICFVHSDNAVNLAVFNANGQQRAMLDVILYQGEGAKPEDIAFCEWMPYQIGQAKKNAEETK